nr:RNA polymerase sigma-70 factor [Rhabdobacter roseus]
MQQHDDELAFGELYGRYFRPLFNYTYAKVNDEFTTQEIVQELFVSLWQQRHRYAVQVCRPYLFSMAKNLVINYFRKEFTRQRHHSQWGTLRPETTDPSDQQALTGDLQHRYEEGLKLLPEKCREVFVLSRQGLPHREIAGTLGISEKTVEQHITKALRILRGHLKEHLLYFLTVLQLFL